MSFDVLIKYFSSFARHQEEDPDCGGASGLSPSLSLMVALQLVLLWVLNGSRNLAVPS